VSYNNSFASDNVRSHSLYRAIAPFSVAFFLGAAVTDLVYWRVPDAMWETFSIWLITAGLVAAAFSVVAGVIDLVRFRKNPRYQLFWLGPLATALALVIATINAFVHSRDGYTAVVPTGLILSWLVVVILACTLFVRRSDRMRAID
jgi:uncharacterized membrane protein